MARGHDTYSRVVAWLKILLPLLALAVLGTVFLITSDDGFEVGFNFSQSDIDTLEAGSFLSEPQINGITERGEPFHIVAQKIAPEKDDPNMVVVTALSGDFNFASGGWVKITADTALVDLAAQTVSFQSGGQLETSDGNVAEVASLTVQMLTGEMEGGAIVADGPIGHISADDFRIEANGSENRVLWFENNVKVVYALNEEGR